MKSLPFFACPVIVLLILASIQESDPVIAAAEMPDSDSESAPERAGTLDPAPVPAPAASPVEPSYSSVQAAMLAENNRLRNALGLSSDQPEPSLMRAAQAQANWLARTGRFAHRIGPSGRTTPALRASAAGYSGSYRSEIIARSSTNSARHAFRIWMNSSGHRRAIRGKHTQAGFGVASSGDRVLYVGLYGGPRSSTYRPTVRYSRPQPVQIFRPKTWRLFR